MGELMDCSAADGGLGSPVIAGRHMIMPVGSNDVAAETIYLPRSEEVERMSTEELRASFLLEGLFEPGQVHVVCTDMDRLAIGGAVPRPALMLPACPQFGTRYFTERREVGIFNLGAAGSVEVGGLSYPLDRLDCLYVGIGEESVILSCGPAGQSVFYFLSCPAHRKYATVAVKNSEALRSEIGDPRRASLRCIHKCIFPGGVQSCQLVMGFTELHENSVWNTIMPHTHSRRSEVYLYFDLEGEVAVHLIGRPERSRNLIVRDNQAVLSPPWSIHCAAGMRNYKFVWGMCGENQDFDDMDSIGMEGLR
jgi:4-deoxy-L-threo-5-hexosulose-uronate ketol-isomerase